MTTTNQRHTANPTAGHPLRMVVDVPVDEALELLDAYHQDSAAVCTLSGRPLGTVHRSDLAPLRHTDTVVGMLRRAA